MATDDQTLPSSAGRSFTIVLICVLALSFAFVRWMNHSKPEAASETGGLAVGSPAPELQADMWLQGEAPQSADLEGEVYVVIAWATWCLPCYQEAPHLVEVYDQFESQGVRFFGLTREPVEAGSQIREWLNDRQIPWPNGFGPGTLPTLEAYQAEYIPAAWVIGRDGTVWWNMGMSETESLEDALQRTLKDSLPPASKSNSS